MKILLTLAVLTVGACVNADGPPPQDTRADPVAAPPAVSSVPVASAAPGSPSVSASPPAVSSAPVPTPTAPAPSASSAPVSGDKVYDQTTTSIDARVGDHFSVVVPGNATTSYTWRVDPKPDASVLTVADPKYTPAPPPGCNGQCVGYGGTYAFAATANAAGTAKLHLVKVHIGRTPGAPVQEVTIAVTVK